MTGYVPCDKFTQTIAAINTELAQGAAKTVPAVGVLSGTLPATVVLNSTTNFGVGAAATDTSTGVVSLAVASNYPSSSNVEAVTPAYLAVMNAAILAGNFGTFSSALRPTSAPSVSDPASVKTNTNGEVFMWNGTAWVYIGGGPNGFEGTLQATQYPMLAFTANTQILESAIVTITNPSSTRAMKVIFSETNVWLSYIQSVGNVTVDFIVEVHAVGAGVVYGTYNGRAIGAPNFPAGSEQSIAQVGILPFGASWIVAASSAQQFKITLRSSNNNGGVVTPAAGVVPVIHLSGKYKTEFLN
jgi:hypothetical protein